MDKIKKFLLKLTKKERKEMQGIMNDILSLQLSHYDIKKLKGLTDVYRARKGDIRIVFAKQNKRGVILDIDFRKNIYKK